MIENIFFANLVQNATDELNYLINIVSGNSTNSTSENQLYQDLLRWRDSDKTNKKRINNFVKQWINTVSLLEEMYW